MNENIFPNPKKPDVAVPSDLDDICVSGITPFTTIDFPGHLAGVFYLQGCPWRCRYCYNPEFWPFPPEGNIITLDKIKHYLSARVGHLEGVVFSGGEPTVHEHLFVWMNAVKSMGFKVGLHTTGMYPDRLREVLSCCDWIGMDVKAPFHLYEKIVRARVNGATIRESASIVIQSQKPYEFRTTFHPRLISEKEILELATDLASMGGVNFALQMVRVEHAADKSIRNDDTSLNGISAGLRQSLESLFKNFQLRG